MRKYLVLGEILVLLALALATIYYLVKDNFYLTRATGVFWHGAIAGFAGCLFLASLILTVFLRTTKDTPTKKYRLVFLMLVLSGIVASASIFFKPGDSDIWWYGAIAGFLVCLLLVFLSLTVYLVIRLKAKQRNTELP